MQIEEIKGIGPKTTKILNKLGINNIDDLITYYPFRYDVLKRTDMSNVKDGDKIIIDGYLEEDAKMFRFNGHMDKMTFRFNTGSNLFNVSIFNRGFLKSKLVIGTKVTILGKLDLNHNSIVASSYNFV